VLGLYDRFVPRFAKQYAQLGQAMRNALVLYREEVEKGSFPDPNIPSPWPRGRKRKCPGSRKRLKGSEKKGTPGQAPCQTVPRYGLTSGWWWVEASVGPNPPLFAKNQTITNKRVGGPQKNPSPAFFTPRELLNPEDIG